jgi:pyrroline-5-carboxylate reductase
MELLAAIAEKSGLPKRDARLMSVQTAKAAAFLADQGMYSPEELRRMVTSKKGTTEAALKVLFKKRFPQILEKAVRAAERRGRELSRR